MTRKLASVRLIKEINPIEEADNIEKVTETEQKILRLCQKQLSGNKEILIALGYKSLSGNVKKALKRVREIGAITYIISDKPKSQHQKYRITEWGKAILEKINQ